MSFLWSRQIFWIKFIFQINRQKTFARGLIKQNHTCGYCGLGFIDGEDINLHHIDSNHNNWKPQNVTVLHKSCHYYIHMSKKET
jgi:5-methylcytosine-specific restriction endonuclease McrA